MTAKEVNDILTSFLSLKSPPYDKPNQSDWQFLKSKFKCDFANDLILFYEYIGNYRFFGELLGVVRLGNIFTRDTISVVYDHEMTNGAWPSSMIPFYSIGNGDYICFSVLLGQHSPIYYVNHEDDQLYIDPENAELEEIYSDFSAWIRDCKTYIGD